jgi:hypothetical protein
MTDSNFEIGVRSLLSRKQFRAFTIELVSGHRIEIDHRRALILVDTLAVFFSPGGPAVVFDGASVRFIINAPAHEAAEWPGR